MGRTALIGTAALALAGLAAGCGGGTPPPRWSYIYPAVIEPTCATASCHSDAAHQADVRLHTLDVAYDNLVPLSGGSPKHFVIPGDPVRSKLLYMLRADSTERMPRDVPLPDADIDLIEAWILAGAQKD